MSAVGTMVSARGVVGRTLRELGGEHPNVWGLTSDVGDPIKPFADAFPDRYVDVGIAEQNVVGIAAGLALEGMIPFVAGMAPFISMRSLEQNRTDVCYQDLPVRFVGWGGGLTTGGGSTHNAMEDIALMRTLVNMAVVSCSDPNMVATVMRQSIVYDHPLYIRLGKGKSDPCIYEPESMTGEIGRGLVAREGSAATIMAHGELVAEALAAAESLASDGIDARVVDMYSIKPLDTELLLRCIDETGYLVVTEDHLAYGGLSSAIADVLVDADVRPKGFRRLGIPQLYTGFGSAPEQWAKYGYGRDGIAATVRALLPE